MRESYRTVARTVALLAAVGLAGGNALAEGDPPSLPRALFLEKTSRDAKAALAAFEAVAGDAASDAATRVEARLGSARCLSALGRGAEAVAAWRSVLEDANAPLPAKEEARAGVEGHEKARTAAAQDAAEATRIAEMRRTEEAGREREARKRAAERLVASAREHVRAGRYDAAKDDLIRALERNPDDAEAAALLEEVGGWLADRGDLLKQAIRFVSSNRLADYRRLVAQVDALKDSGRKSLKEGRPAEAARSLLDAVNRVDESDFFADLADRRRELVLWLQRALDECRAQGSALGEGMAVPAPPKGIPPGPAAWRGEFFSLLGKVFSARGETPSIRFLEAAAPPDPEPKPAASDFTASGIAASPGPGTLRRARWLERYVRAEIAPGSWAMKERLLDRYDDLLVVQHHGSVLRLVEEAALAFSTSPPKPVRVEALVYAAETGGVLDAIERIDAKARRGDLGTSAVVTTRRLDEQAARLDASQKLVLLGRASLTLSDRRHAASLLFRERTANSPLYASDASPPMRVEDADATYGLVLDLYAEDLPLVASQCAVSVVATVTRPDRARVLPLAAGPVRAPVLLRQSVEADRRVPHGGSLALFGLSNPFRGTGAGGDLAGGTHPDLLVVLAARPPSAEGTGGKPDVASPPPAAPRPAGDSSRETREYDLGPLATEIVDRAPPEDWPSTPFAARPGPEPAAAARDAFLAGWLAERMTPRPEPGSLSVRDGRLYATLSPAEHVALSAQVAALVKEEARVYALEVRATEVPAARAKRIREEEGAAPTRAADGEEARVSRLDGDVAARLEERLSAASEPNGLFTLDERVAARHTQSTVARRVRTRSAVLDFKVSKRPDGAVRVDPVEGDVEEGIVVTVRPTAFLGGLTMLHVNAILARVERTESWTPPAEGTVSVPAVSLPKHSDERRGAFAVIAEGETLLLSVPSPGADGDRVVLIRVRR